MRNTTKTRFGLITTAGAGVAALAIAGLALPARADERGSSTDWTQISSSLTAPVDALQTWISDAVSADGTTVAPVTGVSPDTSVGDVSLIEGPLTGDILSGNQAPIASGNDVTAPVGSGNDVAAPVDVTAPIEAPVGSGNDTSVDAPVDAGTDTGLSVGDIGADVSDIVDNVTGDLDSVLDLGGLLR